MLHWCFQEVCPSNLCSFHRFDKPFGSNWNYCLQKWKYFGRSFDYKCSRCRSYCLCLYFFYYLGCTTTDFTGAGPYLFIFCLVLSCFGFALIFWKNPLAQLVYSCLGAFLFSVYIIYDTQLIVGSGKYKFSLDDAYLAAINLYLDIVNLFLHILRIIGRWSWSNQIIHNLNSN